MAVTQAELNAKLMEFQAAQDAETSKINGFITDALSAFTKLEAKIASLGTPDLAPELALVSAALQKFTDNATALTSADAQAKLEGI